jgi:hypothetical protein
LRCIYCAQFGKKRKLANPKRGKWNYLAGDPIFIIKIGEGKSLPFGSYTRVSLPLRLDIPCIVHTIKLGIGCNSAAILRRHDETGHGSSSNT